MYTLSELSVLCSKTSTYTTCPHSLNCVYCVLKLAQIPTANDISIDFRVRLFEDAPNRRTIYSSKGVFEPPLNLAISVPLAIKDAIASARKDNGLEGAFHIDTPLTCEVNSPSTLFLTPSLSLPLSPSSFFRSQFLFLSLWVDCDVISNLLSPTGKFNVNGKFNDYGLMCVTLGFAAASIGVRRPDYAPVCPHRHPGQGVVVKIFLTLSNFDMSRA